MPLVAHWPLHEDSGSTAYDFSGNENHGTTSGGVTQGATGVLGNTAYDFDGTDDYVDTGISTLSSPLTVSFWAYLNDNTDFNTWGNFNSTGSDFYIFIVDGQYAVRADGTGASNSSYTDTTIGGNPTTGWVHFTAVLNNGTEIYTDGTLIASASGSNATFDSGITYGIGYNGSSYFNGRIAEVRVYDHALTESEVQYLYSNTKRSFMRTNEKTN